ncbi:MAG TPA: hypothetical protein PKD00_03195 [Burkholderiales bacterium]|nr:hypothetical protein [Burkholderiales bacterium]
MENLEYQIEKLGTLKYPRIKSLNILKKEINDFGYNFNNVEIKKLLDAVLNNTLEGKFNLKFKEAFNKIFDDMQYIEYDNYKEENNFYFT